MLDRLHVSDILSNFTGTKSVSIAISTSITNTRNINRHDLATVPVPSSMLSFLFLALMARLSSVDLISKIPALNVSFNQQEVIVFVKQPDSRCADPTRILTLRSTVLFVTIIAIVRDEFFSGQTSQSPSVCRRLVWYWEKSNVQTDFHNLRTRRVPSLRKPFPLPDEY